MVLPVEGEDRVVSAITVDGEKFGARARTTEEALEILEKYIDAHAKGSRNLVYLRIDRVHDTGFVEALVVEDRRPGFPERHIDNRPKWYFDRM